MALKDIQTNKNDIQEYLLLIAKVPEKVDKIDIDIKKELLIDIEKRIICILNTVNYRLIDCSNETFEYAALNTFQIFNYYELKNLKFLIENSIEQSRVNTENKDLLAIGPEAPKNGYLGYPTNENANRLFDYLIEYYRPGEKTSVKYVNILHYLKKDAKKDLYIFNVKQLDFKQLIISKIGIEIKKFEISEQYSEVEKHILNSLETSFRKKK